MISFAGRSVLGCIAVWLISSVSWADALKNPDFESGNLTNWTVGASYLGIGVSTNTSFNRNYSARMNGSYAAGSWITNTLSQTIQAKGGDDIRAEGFVFWKQQVGSSTAAAAQVNAFLDGPFGHVQTNWTSVHDNWKLFTLSGEIFGIAEGGFESGTLAGWTAATDPMVPAVCVTNVVDNGRYSLQLKGTWNGWAYNQVYQTFTANTGDVLQIKGRVYVHTLTTTGDWVAAGLKIEKDGGAGASSEKLFDPSVMKDQWLDVAISMTITSAGPYRVECAVMGGNNGTSSAEVYFDQVSVWRAGLVPGYLAKVVGKGDNSDSDFLQSNYATNAINLDTQSSTSFPKEVNDSWWTTQPFFLNLDSSQASRNLLITMSPAWADGTGTLSLAVDVLSNTQWIAVGTGRVNAAIDAVVTVPSSRLKTGRNDFRFRTVGQTYNTHTITWDYLTLASEGIENPSFNVTVGVQYLGYSGGTAYTNTADVYADAFTVYGSTALIGPPTDTWVSLKSYAQTIATDASQPIPSVVYPDRFTFGYPGGRQYTNYPAYVEVPFGTWAFRHFSNDVSVRVTNTITISEIAGAGHAFIEFDQYAYVDKYYHTDRGTPVDVGTNAPFFTLGQRDNSSAEFGNGPFPATHTYVVGTSLTNFPRRMTTDGSGGWPSKLQIVFDQNFKQHNLGRDLFFLLATVPTNGPASNVKICHIGMDASDPTTATNASVASGDVRMGWASEADARGMVDYPNVESSELAAVGVRQGGKYNIADDGSGWFVQQSPRGSSDVEPTTLYMLRNGAWLQHIYEEYLYLWPSAASGVRSIFDDDSKIRIPGSASYDISFRMGHASGTNEFGEPNYQEVLEVRGSGYLRMWDFDSYMAGRFRPMLTDPQGLYRAEDTFLIPQSYVRIVSRTTPTNQPDNSYAQTYALIRSASNQSFIGTVKLDHHYVPDEVANTGVYMDVDADLWAKRNWTATNEGSVAVFGQAATFWRGDLSYAVNQTGESHSADVVLWNRADGEWINYQLVNPPTNSARIRLGTLSSGDVVYVQQQDRGNKSYAASYQKDSGFELTLLQAPARAVNLDVYSAHVLLDDQENIFVAGAVDENIPQGDHLAYRYRYRALYAPGVTVLNPNSPDGGDNWSNQTYAIDFLTTDPESRRLQANLYYGNGRTTNWTLINTGGPIWITGGVTRVTYPWNVTGVAPGAYYVKAVVQTGSTGRVGFDVSDARLWIGTLYGFPRSGTQAVIVTTNGQPYVGNDMSFESGGMSNWNSLATNWHNGAPDLTVSLTNNPAGDGAWSLNLRGSWSGSSYDSVWQEIPCQSGETLQVTARLRVDALRMTGAGPLSVGLKLESTNTDGRTTSGVEFDTTVTTGVWMDVAFSRVAPVTGTDNLQLWISGSDCAAANIYFDGITVLSTNHGSVHVETRQYEYWRAATSVNVSAYRDLQFRAAGTNSTSNLVIWVSDSTGVTNTVRVTNFVQRLYSIPQDVRIPWTNFASVNKTKIAAIGYTPVSSDASDVRVSRMQAVAPPVRVTTALRGAPAVDFEGLSLYNPGQTVTNVIIVSNQTASAMSNLTIRTVQAYAETRTWLDSSPFGQPAPQAATREGNRLCGPAEQAWSNVSIAAGGQITITNIYTLPLGRNVVATNSTGAKTKNYYVDRNAQGRARVSIVIQTSTGAVYAQEQAALYAMDDDFDIDNDGLPDWWELQYFGSRTAANPNDDPDHDGFSNLMEYQQGTDPTNAASHPVASLTLQILGNPGSYGHPTPVGYGTFPMLSNDTVQDSVDTYDLVAPDVRERSLGWMGAGSVPTSGPDSQVLFLIKTNSTLTWKWSTEYALKQYILLDGASSGGAGITATNLARAGSGYGHFGSSISVDGSRAAVGVDGQDGAYVFRRLDHQWSQEARLIGNDAVFGNQLSAVGLSGPRLVAGCPADDDRGSQSGSAYVFVRSALVWTQEVKLVPSDLVAGDRFGWSVALDSNTAVVGAPGPYYSLHPGSAYVFKFTNGAWQSQAKLNASDGTISNEFGSAVALSGPFAAVGAFGGPASNQAGAAYVFRWTGSNWVQQSELTLDTPTSGDQFGRSIALSGTNLLVGAPGVRGTGSAYVYEWTGTNWVRRTELTAGCPAGSRFGSSVALKGDYAVVGAEAELSAGAAYLFHRAGSDWQMIERLAAAVPATNGLYGGAAGIDAPTVVVGSPYVGGTGSVFACRLFDTYDLAFSWLSPSQTVSTLVAYPTYTDPAGTVYTFKEWRVDGMRKPDATNPAANPVSSLVMDTPHNAAAVYAAATQTLHREIGIADGLHQEFLQSSFPTNSLNLLTIPSTGFPVELNDSTWKTQGMFIVLTSAQAARDLTLHLNPDASDGTGALVVALEIQTGGQWVEVGRTNLSGTLDGDLTVPADLLAEGQNNLRLRVVGNSGNTHRITWDQIVIDARDAVAVPDPDPAWFGADTHAWAKQDWAGPTYIVRTQFQGRTCLKVSATRDEGFITTEDFPTENWAPPVRWVEAEVYLASWRSDARIRLEVRGPTGRTLSIIHSDPLIPLSWNKVTWPLPVTNDFSAISALTVAFEGLGMAGADFYVDRIRLVSDSGPRNWDMFEARGIRWSVSADQSPGYDDSVDFNTNGANDSVTTLMSADGSVGSLYLPWNGSATPADYVKLYTADPGTSDWSQADGLTVKVKSSSTCTSIRVSFFDGSNVLQTVAHSIRVTNAWHQMRFALPASGNFAWTNIHEVAFIVTTTSNQSGQIYFDDIRQTAPNPIQVSNWTIGREDYSCAEFQTNSITNAYVVDYHCMQSFRDFPDRIADTNPTITVMYPLGPAQMSHTARLSVGVVPDTAQSAQALDVYAGTSRVGSLNFNPSAGDTRSSVDIPATLLSLGTNVLRLTKQAPGGVLRFDVLDLSSLYTETNLYDILAGAAAAEYPFSYVEPSTNYWYPLQTINFTSYNMIRNIGMIPGEPERLIAQPNDAGNWGVLQRPTGQWATYPFDILRFEGGGRYAMYPFDIDDWDWSAAETNDLRPEFADAWPTLDHTQIPKWSQYFSNLEIMNENPPGSGSWPWNIAARAVGYLKLTCAYASHASSPRMPFYNVLNYYTNGSPDNEVQSRMPQVFVRIRGTQEIVVSGMTDCTNSVGAYEMHVGNYYTPDMGYYTQARVRSKTWMRRDFNVADTTNGRVCIAGVASMFWKDENFSPEDSSDESHDNDMIMVVRTNGTIVSHKLGQFPLEWTNERITNMTDVPPKIYNLCPIGPGDTLYILQQDRNIDHYKGLNLNQEDYNPDFQNRGSFAYKILTANRRFVVKVYECHPWLDTWDNEVITIETDPTDTTIHRGDTVEMDYDLTSFVTPGVFFDSPNRGTVDKALDSTINLLWEAHHPQEDATTYVQNISLDYSVDGLQWTGIASNLANTGTYAWNISSLAPTSYVVRIRGQATDGMVGWDVTDEKIQVVNTPSQPGLFLSSGTGEIINLQYEGLNALIQWQAVPTGAAWRVGDVKLQYSADHVQWTDLGMGLTNSGSYLWNLLTASNGTYWLRIYGQASDGTVRSDTSASTITITNYATFPILIGTKDYSDQEFLQDANRYSTNVYDAHRMFVSTFPKELGTNFWTNQDISVEVNQTVMNQGLILVLAPAWNNSTGTLNVAVSVDSGSGFAPAGTIALTGTDEGGLAIPPPLLRPGRVVIRLRPVSCSGGTYVVTWDQIRILSPQPVNVVLGQNNNSEMEFEQNGGNYQRVFDADTMVASNFPKELNTTWWSNQDIRIALSASTAQNGLTLLFNSMWADGSGVLNVQVLVDCGRGFTNAGVFSVNAAQDGVLDIPPSVLAPGFATIRLQATSGTAGTTVAIWDQIIMREMAVSTPLNLVLGQDNGSEMEFQQNGSLYVSVFNPDVMTVSNFPKELNTTWWSNQDIRLNLGSVSAQNGLSLTLDSMWTDGSGALNVQILITNSLGKTVVGTVAVNALTKGVVDIPSSALTPGINILRLIGASGSSGTTVAVWDQIIVKDAPYTVHLAYTNGTDLFPRTTAQQTNYTGAACSWMIARYLNGGSWSQSQDVIYGATAHDPVHSSEITPASCASWMWTNAPSGYYFSARYRTNLTDALKECVYWMDYLPPGGLKTPAYIVCGTNWSYKVMRGFETDRKPYDGSYGISTSSIFTVQGVRFNDPRVSGLGYDTYVSAQDMQTVWLASESVTGTNRFWLIVEPPQDAAEQAVAEARMDASTLQLATPESNPAMAGFLQSLLTVASGTGSKTKAFSKLNANTDAGTVSDLRSVLPNALRRDEAFMDLFARAVQTNYYIVNPDDPQNTYVLAAGEQRGPGSTVFVFKLDPAQGTLQQATWDANPSLYPPISPLAAEWVARKTVGGGISFGGTSKLGSSGPTLVEAKLVYDPQIDASPFRPRWQLVFSNAGQLITNEIPQDVDLSGDTDGDGMSDRLELYAGFDPSDAASRFSVQAGQLSGSDPNTVVITWSSASGCFYSMYRATNMLASFELLRMHIPATAPVNSYTDHVSSVQSYYRIETE